MSFADIKKQKRRAVHTAFAVPVLFYPAGTRIAKFLDPMLTARIHNKLQVMADPLSGGFAQIQDGVTHVVFDTELLAAAGIAPKQGDVVEFPDYGFAVRLDIEDQVTASGPIVQKWTAGPAK